jgi:hypothetical protein
MEREHLEIEVEHPRCPYCKDAVQPEQEKSSCHGCMAWHHAECWDEHGACSACGATALADATAQQRRTAPSSLRPQCTWGDCTRPARGFRAPGFWPLRVRAPAGQRCLGHRLCSEHLARGLRRVTRATPLILLMMGAFLAMLVLAVASGADLSASLPELIVVGLFLLNASFGLWRRKALRDELKTIEQELAKAASAEKDPAESGGAKGPGSTVGTTQEDP